VPRPQLADVEPEGQDLGRALRLAVRQRRAGGVGRAARRAERAVGGGLRDDEQQPLRLRTAERKAPPPAPRRARDPRHRRRRATGDRAAIVGDMKVLAVIHGTNAPGGVFEETVRAAGHDYDEWSLAWGQPSPRPLDEYDAVLVFGGSMHAD